MNNPQHSSASGYNSFVPVCLVALSVITILTWELISANRVHSNSLRLQEQQARIVEQSKQVQAKLEKLARDLIEVAANDDDAKAIVTKFQINVTKPAPAASASPATSPTPAP